VYHRLTHTMSGDSQIREELGELFHDAVTQHEDVMAECKWIVHLSPAEFIQVSSPTLTSVLVQACQS
jgi:hypothetical protein